MGDIKIRLANLIARETQYEMEAEMDKKEAGIRKSSPTVFGKLQFLTIKPRIPCLSKHSCVL
jgi:hypothetical protein